MSEPLPISEEIRDAMQEICNVAMGAAGESLALFSGVFVELPIPKIRFVKPQAVTEALAGLGGEDKISAVMQSFAMGETPNNQALVAITETGLNDLAQQRGVALESPDDAMALLKELATVIVDNCLPHIAEQLELDNLTQGELQTVAASQLLENVQIPEIVGGGHLLTAEINYHLEGHPFNCDLLLLMPEAGLERTIERLQRLL